MSANTVQHRLLPGDPTSSAYWGLLLGIPLVIAAAVIFRIAPAAPMPDYLRDAQQYAATGHIHDVTYPVAFAWMAGISMRLLGNHGWEVLQAGFYISTVLLVWAMARRCGATARAALCAGLAATLYAQLPISIAKFWDVEISVWLMALVLLLILLLRSGLRPWVVTSLGLALGLSFAQRPNMLLLVPLPAFICLRAKTSWWKRLVAIAAAGAIAAATLIAINTAAHGSFFLSQNGPYNLVQGHNEFTVQTLLDDLSCEPSVGMILRADGMQAVGFNEADPALQVYFKRRALRYIRSHPLGEIEIAAVKLWTLLRPNTRMHRGLSAMAAAIVAMSLIFPVWLILLVWRGTHGGLNAVDRLFIIASVLYVLPFLLTSSDPRYQIPIEICMLAHIAGMWTRTKASQENVAGG